MYNWLQKKFNKNTSNIIMILWYLFLLFLILRYISIPNGRFKYLEW